jgi:deazaflavin-dependent oxidoreductase (nitroreductase family)
MLGGDAQPKVLALVTAGGERSRWPGGLMEPQQAVLDNPTGWVANHIRRYVESDGRKGHEWRTGVYTLLLTTRGRKSGNLRRTALIYGRDGDRYLVVASLGGAPRHPAWYLNLVEHPEVQVQAGADRFAARARTATAEEKPPHWRLMASIWPDYDRDQKNTSRDIPVVIQDRV